MSAAVTAIVTAMRARTGYRSCWAAGDGDDVPVYHSAEAGLIGEHPVTSLVIASGEDPLTPREVVDSRQARATYGPPRRRDESGLIRCRATAVSGDVSDGAVQAAWAAAVGIVDDVDDELRGTSGVGPSLGLAPDPLQLMVAVLEGVTGISPWLAGGVVVDVDFSIGITARI